MARRKIEKLNVQTLETLTPENARIGLYIVCKQHPEWGVKQLRQDRNGWFHYCLRGSAMLFECEFHFWAIIGRDFDEMYRNEQRL